MIRQLKSIMRDARDEVLEICLKDCVHYCGFSYDDGYFNPYANYLRDYHAGLPLDDIRQRFAFYFEQFLPEDLGEVFQINTKKKYYSWQLPWATHYREGWFMNIVEVPDIVSHFSEEGVLRHRIEEECSWLESAYFNIKRLSYQPKQHTFIRINSFVDSTGRMKHLLADGNHRVSAMLALGIDKASVRRHPRDIVKETELKRWPLVRAGIYNSDDAMKIFHAYFDSPRNQPVSKRKNRIIDARGTVLTSDFSRLRKAG